MRRWDGMEITLLYFEGCPHSQLTSDRITSAIEGLDRDDIAGPKHVLVNTPEDANRLGFRGSPTILIDGRDPFPTDSPVGFSCRVYRTEHGTDGAPSVEQLHAAFQQEPRGRAASVG